MMGSGGSDFVLCWGWIENYLHPFILHNWCRNYSSTYSGLCDPALMWDHEMWEIRFSVKFHCKFIANFLWKMVFSCFWRIISIGFGSPGIIWSPELGVRDTIPDLRPWVWPGQGVTHSVWTWVTMIEMNYWRSSLVIDLTFGAVNYNFSVRISGSVMLGLVCGKNWS